MALTRELIGSLKSGQSLSVFIGPEGGFSDGEVELAMQSGVKPVTLGKRILRTETAGMFVMAAVGLYWNHEVKFQCRPKKNSG